VRRSSSDETLTAAPPVAEWRRRWQRRLRVAGATIGVVALAGLAVVAVAVLSGRWQIRPILSGSMRPGFAVGGVVVTERVPLADLRLGEVAVFHPPGQPSIDYVHRVIALHRGDDGLVVHTKGDDNLYPDPWTLHVDGRYAYVARFTVPFLGYAAIWVHSPGGRRIILLAAGLLALGLVAAGLLERRHEAAAPPRSRSGDRRAPRDGAGGSTELATPVATGDRA